ncbi:hypothetical protein B6U81_03410 [Thermoplasmatales archaeon ex4484_30]|nr:MAG: hypothetical protein B6U81_03410 [Thermoplasmatales archaeon ex4484_30]
MYATPYDKHFYNFDKFWKSLHFILIGNDGRSRSNSKWWDKREERIINGKKIKAIPLWKWLVKIMEEEGGIENG